MNRTFIFFILLLLSISNTSVSSELKDRPERLDNPIEKTFPSTLKPIQRDKIKATVPRKRERLIEPLVSKKKRIAVKISAYTSRAKETDNSPFTPAFTSKVHRNYTANDKRYAVAVSRDLLSHHAINPFSKLELCYANQCHPIVVRDTMNQRYSKRVDIYYYTDLNNALQFGVKSGHIIIR